MFTNLLSHLNIKEPLLQYELAKDSIVEFVPKNSQIMKQGQYVKWFTIIVTCTLVKIFNNIFFFQ